MTPRLVNMLCDMGKEIQSISERIPMESLFEFTVEVAPSHKCLNTVDYSLIF